MRTLLPTLLLLAACSSTDWTQMRQESHPALVPGAEIVTYARGRGASRAWRVEIRSGGVEVPAHTVDEVMPFVRPIDNPDAAIAYADLVRNLGLAEAGATGQTVQPDPKITGSGGSGRYSRSDAEAWGVPFEPVVRPFGGGFEVSHVVVQPPVKHPVLDTVSTPWKLVYIREVVSPDGTIRGVEARTLSNSDDAARFANH